jgi:hypothetical protein
LNVVEVQLNDGPQGVCDPCGVTVFDQPVGIKDESCGAQCWTVPLGSTCGYRKSQTGVKRVRGMQKRTPITGESGLVDVELGFAQAAGGLAAAEIGDLLDALLRKEKLVDLAAEGNVFSASDFLSDRFESERSIADP